MTPSAEVGNAVEISAETASGHSLAQLAGLINQTHEQSHGAALLAKSNVESSLDRAIKCGEYLAEAKDLCQHGEWLKWLSDNCPKITERTAQNYMRLNTKYVSLLGQAKGLRQAYLLADIIQEPKRSWKIQDCQEEVAAAHEPEQSPVDPMDGRASEQFPYEQIDIGTRVTLEDEGETHVLADGLKELWRWVVKGDGPTVLGRSLAVGWVLGVIDEDRFKSFPSAHDLAVSYGIHPSGFSRHTSDLTRSFGVQNRAQAHGDGVRK